jgi:FkbM family methyltransferase
MTLKQNIKNFFRTYGYEVSSRGGKRLDHLHAISSCIGAGAKVIFDVGANRGQTLECLHPFFKNAHFYCFEPDPQTFEHLVSSAKLMDRVSTFNLALGMSDGSQVLYTNEASEGNSLLRVSPNFHEKIPGWLKGRGETQVLVSSVDSFCKQYNIESIDLLKLDTQGYEANVLRGAASLLAQRAVKAIFSEVLFSEYYEGQAYFDDVYAVLKSNGYRLVDLYQKFHLKEGPLATCDALFIR